MLQKKCFAFAFTLVIAITATSQTSSGKNEIGVNVGGMFYQGDLTPNLGGSLKTMKPTIGIYYNRIITPYWAIRASVYLGGLQGNDAWYQEPAYMQLRRLRFHTPLAEASVLGVFDIFGNHGNNNALKFSPYVFAGLGGAFLDIYRDWSRIDSSMIHTGSGTLAGLQKDSATTLKNAIPVLPVGVGVKYGITSRISLTLEANYRFLFTDHLDGFSYVANPKKNDGYYTLTIGAVYNFSSGSYNGKWKKGKSKLGCPKVF